MPKLNSTKLKHVIPLLTQFSIKATILLAPLIWYLDHQIVWGFGDKQEKYCKNCNKYYTGSKKVTIGGTKGLEWKIYLSLVSQGC